MTEERKPLGPQIQAVDRDYRACLISLATFWERVDAIMFVEYGWVRKPTEATSETATE